MTPHHMLEFYLVSTPLLVWGRNMATKAKPLKDKTVA